MQNYIIEEIFMSEAEECFRKLYNCTIFNRGETVVKNKSKYITVEEIKRCINLLHSVYFDLGIELIVYNTKFQPLFKTLPSKNRIDWFTYKKAYRGEIGGNHRGGLITMFPFNYRYNSHDRKKEKYKLFLVFDIFHEIRHAYQRIHKEREYWNSHKKYICAGNKGYSSQWIERDANQFAQRMMNKHKKEINEILGINFDWDCVWGLFTIR